MCKIVGSVDHLGRPTIRVAIAGREDSVLGTVDTGFNGEIMMTAGDALHLGLRPRDEAERVELGDGASVKVKLCRMKITWLDREREVVVFVSKRTDASREGPRLLIGTRLLTPHLLFVDFERRTVEIEPQS